MTAIGDGGPLSDTSTRWLYTDRPARRAGQLPFWLVAYLVLLPAQVPLPGLLRLAPSDVCLLVLAVTSARQIRVRRGVISGWHVALVVSFSVGLLYAALLHNAVTVYAVANKYTGLYLLLLGYIVVTWFAPDPTAARLVLRRFLQGVVVFTTGTLALYVVGIAAGTSKPPFSFGGRYVGLLVDPNAQGGLLTLALILFVATRGRPGALLTGRWAMVAIVVLPLALVATGSRSAWLAAAVGFLVILFSQPAQAARALVVVALPVLMSAVIFGIGVSKLSGDSLNRSNTIGQRIEIIDVALDDARQEPVLGGGLGTYFARHGEIVHNTPVWFLADLGVVGLVVFTGLVLWILMQGIVARRWFRRDRDLLLGLIIADVAMIGLSAGIEAFAQRHWWLAMALLGSLGATAHEMQGEQE